MSIFSKPVDETRHPTHVQQRFHDGRMLGIDGSMWLYGVIPLAPIVDSKSRAASVEGGDELTAIYEELAAIARVDSPKRRRLNRSNYRQTHLLLVNSPDLFKPPTDDPNHDFWVRNFRSRTVDRRLLLLGVKVNASITGGRGGWRGAIDSVVDTIMEGGTPISDFDEDLQKIKDIFSRWSVTAPTNEQVALANGWWNHGNNPDVASLPHGEHTHFMSTPEAVRLANASGVNEGDCDNWGNIPDASIVTFAAMESLDLNFVSPIHSIANWVTGLIADGATVVSIRGKVEPSVVTREELRAQRKRYRDDIMERTKAGKMERAEQEEMEMLLRDVDSIYALNGPATLVDSSVIVGFDGQIEDAESMAPSSSAMLRNMTWRQPHAYYETMMCSSIRANPYLHDFPVQVIGNSGVQSLSNVGDASGALLGFTENDSQPVYINSTAASDEDTLPLMLVMGQTGSGKSQVLLSLAYQWSLSGRPQIIIDPKTGSDHSATVRAAGGTVHSLDDLTTADGIFDPIRFSRDNLDVGIDLASSLLLSINPWGNNKDMYESYIDAALHCGVYEGGATSIGTALEYAKSAGKAPDDLVDSVIRLATSSPMFRATCGLSNVGEGLSADAPITYIKVGNNNLSLPAPGVQPADMKERVAMALVKMMVFGSAMALTGRGGAVHLDEAWVFLQSSRAEVERLGRLARSQQVLPVLYTQRVTDATNAGLGGYISRGLILPVTDRDEAIKACELFGVEATSDRVGRLMAKDKTGTEGQSANWNSMRALRDVRTGIVMRGAVGIHVDLKGRAANVEVTLPPELFTLSSTNPLDIERRKKAERDKQFSG